MNDEDVPESSNNALKRPGGSSPPVESQGRVGDESQISTFSIDEEISCSICLGVLESPYTVIPCLHTFDKGCLAGWWKQNDTCPLCKIRATSGRHSFQLQAIVNHYDNKRPPRKRAKGSEDTEDRDDRAELYPFGVMPPPPGRPAAFNGNDGDEHEEDDDFELDEDDPDSDDESELEAQDQPGGRIVFPCLACAPGHPSGYVCPIPIPEPSDEVKRVEKEEFFDGLRDPRAPGRGEQGIAFAEGLHNLPGADLLYTNLLVEDINRACQQHVPCASCTTYMPRNRPRSVESTCRICSRATCHLFDPQGCPIYGFVLQLRSFNEAGQHIPLLTMWLVGAFQYHHFRTNNVERQRFTDIMTALNLTANDLAVELLAAAGHAAEDVGPYYCGTCVEVTIRDGINEWLAAKKGAGLFPPEIADLANCWYGRDCRTQTHNRQHAERFNHNCDPRPPQQN